jgi:hypothetical protein
LTPITASMALGTSADESDSMQLQDGRKLYHVKLVGAVRSVEDFSTNVVYEIEDGTGFVEVKQWLDENDNSAIQEMRNRPEPCHHDDSPTDWWSVLRVQRAGLE